MWPVRSTYSHYKYVVSENVVSDGFCNFFPQTENLNERNGILH